MNALQRGICGLPFLTLMGGFAANPAQAHPMGNFAICHYSRFQPGRDVLHLRYVLDMAEIPTLAEKQSLGNSRDGAVSTEAKNRYLAAKTAEYVSGLTLTVDGASVPLRCTGSDLRLSPGAGGLETLKITLDLAAPLAMKSETASVRYEDRNWPERSGWKEIVATDGDGAALRDSTVPRTDVSRELSLYPQDVVPPQVTEASFAVVPRGSAAPATPVETPVAGAVSSDRASTPRDGFTQSIARRTLTPAFIVIGLFLAFCYGAGHALSPGHGKAMVAAYLVGARGTVKHAVFLGLVVTITHTLGVFALGLITLLASRYVVPEKFYSILSLISGLSVCGVGLWLLISRLRPSRAHSHGAGHIHEHSHDHGEAHDHDEGHTHSHANHDHEHSHPYDYSRDYAHSHGHSHSHDHAHDHIHSDDHDRETAHAHADSGRHSHGPGQPLHHHGLPEGPVTARTLLALGISGGIVPCPSALVVLLSAIALHRILFGLLLIVSFSLGLAAVLVGIGIAVVSTRRWFDRIPSGGKLLQRVPIASAALITCIGVVLIVRALGGTP